VPKEVKVEVNVFSDFLGYYIVIGVTLALSLLFSTYCIFKTSHTVIKPLRVLNERMNEILADNNHNEIEMDSGSGHCKEITNLQE
jgi:hypothetical protein